jgi:uncharacterized protein (TIGR03032 family)
MNNPIASSPLRDDPHFQEIRFEYTARFPEVLERCGCSLLVTTYQANKLLALGLRDGRIDLAIRSYEQPMGLAVHPERVAVGIRREVRLFERRQQGLSDDKGNVVADSCLLERSSHVTGKIHGHEMGWGNDGLWIVNTLFSCLCQLQSQYSFVPRWKPRFISQLASEDRCHLNGMAMHEGEPRFVTALATTDTPGGWRTDRVRSGVVIDVKTGETICSGLAMPHSPRVHDGQLFILHSGNGSFGTIDLSTGKYLEMVRSPGYTRGLSFCGGCAFIGLSKIRQSSVFAGLPVSEQNDELYCGIGVVDIQTGTTIAVLKFTAGVSELFAVEVLPDTRLANISGTTLDGVEQEFWIIPPLV